MNQSVRFYWQHDLDLIALTVHPNFDFSGWFKRAIIAWVRGEELTIPLPLEPQPFTVNMENKKICFYLSPENDDDVIKALQEIRKGYRNSAMKLIFRTYLERPYLEPYYNEQTFIAKVRGGNAAEKSTPTNMIVPKSKSYPNNVTVQNNINESEPTEAKDISLVHNVDSSNTTNAAKEEIAQVVPIDSSHSTVLSTESIQHEQTQGVQQNSSLTPQELILQYLQANPAILNGLLQNNAMAPASSIPANNSMDNLQNTSVMNVQSFAVESDSSNMTADMNNLSNNEPESYDISDEEPDECYALFDKM